MALDSKAEHVSVLEAAGIISEGSTKSEQDIMHSAFIRMEGFNRNLPTDPQIQKEHIGPPVNVS